MNNKNAINTNFHSFGFYDDMVKIISSDVFIPTLVTGPTGCGKTTAIIQAHVRNNKSIYRVNVTSETDEDALMGGFRLKDGETVYQDGPVLEAMKNGATLLLDELDLAMPNKILCLQSILEGEPYFVKRDNRFVEPAKGFMVVATANTKMNGDESGSYIGTQIMNAAFRDRFSLIIEHNYPSALEEVAIIKNFDNSFDTKLGDEFIGKLVEWAQKTRDDVDNEESMEIQDPITTRRLIDFVKIYSVFGDIQGSIEKILSKFDSATATSYLQYYQAIIQNVDDMENMGSEDSDEYILEF